MYGQLLDKTAHVIVSNTLKYISIWIFSFKNGIYIKKRFIPWPLITTNQYMAYLNLTYWPLGSLAGEGDLLVGPAPLWLSSDPAPSVTVGSCYLYLVGYPGPRHQGEEHQLAEVGGVVGVVGALLGALLLKLQGLPQPLVNLWQMRFI